MAVQFKVSMYKERDDNSSFTYRPIVLKVIFTTWRMKSRNRNRLMKMLAQSSVTEREVLGIVTNTFEGKRSEQCTSKVQFY